MDLLGNFLTFRNRPWKNPKEGSWLWKRTEKGTCEGSYSKTGTEEKNSEGLDYKTGTENRTDCLKLVSPSYKNNCKTANGNSTSKSGPQITPRSLDKTGNLTSEQNNL